MPYFKGLFVTDSNWSKLTVLDYDFVAIGAGSWGMLNAEHAAADVATGAGVEADGRIFKMYCDEPGNTRFILSWVVFDGPRNSVRLSIAKGVRGSYANFFGLDSSLENGSTSGEVVEGVVVLHAGLHSEHFTDKQSIAVGSRTINRKAAPPED